MKGMEITTETKPIVLQSGEKITIDCIVQLKFTYAINVSEEKRLCPLDARLNPEWRCKEWEEERTELITFYGQSKDVIELNVKEKYKHHLIHLDESGECITRVRGTHSSYISKLEISTNFGRNFVIGHDYPLMLDPIYKLGGYGIGIKDIEERRFELDIPPCSKVVCFIGSHNTDLLSIAAYYA